MHTVLAGHGVRHHAIRMFVFHRGRCRWDPRGLQSRGRVVGRYRYTVAVKVIDIFGNDTMCRSKSDNSLRCRRRQVPHQIVHVLVQQLVEGEWI
jgi:hypothetical protein